MTWTWDAYLRLLRETAATIGQLAQVEREKTAAVSVGNLTEVDECMKREQVFSLRLRLRHQTRRRAEGTGPGGREAQQAGPARPGRATHGGQADRGRNPAAVRYL